jgi:ankyrin repeat protein
MTLKDNTLIQACKNGDLEEVKRLVEQGANMHAKGELALRFASFYGHLDIVNYLVGLGATIHAKDEAALHWASDRGHFKVAKFLEKKGKKINK